MKEERLLLPIKWIINLKYETSSCAPTLSAVTYISCWVILRLYYAHWWIIETISFFSAAKFLYDIAVYRSTVLYCTLHAKTWTLAQQHFQQNGWLLSIASQYHRITESQYHSINPTDECKHHAENNQRKNDKFWWICSSSKENEGFYR